jgi:hypothetical protein
MKKIIFILGICLLCAAIFAGGCLGGNENLNDNFDYVELPKSIDHLENKMAFRGNVTNITAVDNTITIVLEHPAGPHFNGSQISFVFSDSSQMNFKPSELKIGDYVNVSYDRLENDEISEPIVVIEAYRSPFGQAVYRGTIIDIPPITNQNSSTYSGVIKVNLENNSPMKFYCYDTLLYIDPSDLKIGANITIFGDSFVLTSYPGQTSAYEIYYSENQ